LVSDKKIPEEYKKTGNTRRSLSQQAILRWLKQRTDLLGNGERFEELEETCDNCFKNTETKVKLIKDIDKTLEQYGQISCPACHRSVFQPDKIKFNKDNQKRNKRVLKNLKSKQSGEKPEMSLSKKLRRELLEIIGNTKCNRCGFDDVRALQLDHIKGDGTIAKKKFKNSQYEWHFYRHERPDLAKQELQVLCANCNWIKREENDETSWHNSKKDRIDTDIEEMEKYQKELVKYKKI
jgi:hypothetical protein